MPKGPKVGPGKVTDEPSPSRDKRGRGHYNERQCFRFPNTQPMLAQWPNAGLQAVWLGERRVDKKRRHLAMIRTLINRMVAGSFLVKGWSVAVVAALLAVAAQPPHARFAWLALFLGILFWGLDAHLLRQQRLFRKLYERVQKLDEADVDFCMDTAPVDGEASAFGSALFSSRLGLFYGAVIALIAVARWAAP